MLLWIPADSPRELHQNHEDFRLNGINRLLVYADDVNNVIRKKSLFEATREIGLKLNCVELLPVFLHGFEAYLTLREEHRLRVFEKRVLRKIFGQNIHRLGQV
jgi:hypothetical protein